LAKTVDFFVGSWVFGRIKSLLQRANSVIAFCFGPLDFAAKKMVEVLMALVVDDGLVRSSNGHFFTSLTGGKSGMASAPNLEIVI
jgi:hypothetical protein